MSEFDWNSIEKKLFAYLNDSSVERQIEKIKDDVMLGKTPSTGKDGTHTVEEAAAMFGHVLRSTIEADRLLPPGVVRALEDYIIMKPWKAPDGSYVIYVGFENDPTRYTMSSYKEYYPVDIAELYNDGVDHVMAQIIEHAPDGSIRVSNTVIPGTHFLERAIDDFMGNYGTEYNVIKIEIDRKNA